jgi:hypothetical protein
MKIRVVNIIDSMVHTELSNDKLRKLLAEVGQHYNQSFVETDKGKFVLIGPIISPEFGRRSGYSNDKAFTAIAHFSDHNYLVLVPYTPHRVAVSTARNTLYSTSGFETQDIDLE